MKTFLIALIPGFFSIACHAQNQYVAEDLFTIKFSAIHKHPYLDKQYAFFEITNKSDKDIDDIVMGLGLKNADGERLSSNAINDLTPGYLWLKAGATTEAGVPLDGHPEAMRLMRENPSAATLEVEIRRISFSGEVVQK